jgi:hypothetical protein
MDPTSTVAPVVKTSGQVVRGRRGRRGREEKEERERGEGERRCD